MLSAVPQEVFRKELKIDVAELRGHLVAPVQARAVVVAIIRTKAT